MNVILTNIERQAGDPNAYLVAISFGGSPSVNYLASYDASDPHARFCHVEPELFMELSNLAHKRFGDCTVYQMELMSIVRALLADNLNLELPVQLGTTQYCWTKPTLVKTAYNKLRNWFAMARWKLGIGRPEFTGTSCTEDAG